MKRKKQERISLELVPNSLLESLGMKAKSKHQREDRIQIAKDQTRKKLHEWLWA